MANETIVVVEDEGEIRSLIELYLEKDYQVFSYGSGEEALRAMREKDPDLILLDILLPGINGFEICQTIRAEGVETPVLFLSAKRDSEDKIRGLELGADDYIIKPFDPGELVARVKAVLRRSQRRQEHERNFEQENENLLKVGEATIDRESLTVAVNGEPVHFYAKELQLLLLLAKHPDKIFSTEQLYQLVWGENQYGNLKTVAVHIRNLRKKIEKDSSKPESIITVRGFGYKLQLGKNDH